MGLAGKPGRHGQLLVRDNQGVAESMGTTIEARYYVLNSTTSEPARQSARISLDGILRRYGLALAFVFAALLLTLPLQQLFPHPFLFLFFAGVVASAWFGGMLPGLFAVLISTVVVDYFFAPPLYSFAIKATEVSYFAAFVVCSLVASWVSASKKKNEEELKETRSQLQVLVAERTAALQQSTSELQENERHIQLLTEVIPRQAPNLALERHGDNATAAPLEQVLAEVVDFTTSVLRCDSCFVYVLENDELVLRASKNPHPEAVDRLKLKMGQGITGWVAEHGRMVAVSQNASQDPRFQLFNDLPEDRFEAFLSVPLLSRGRLVGVINLQHRDPHRYTDRQIRLISAVGLLVGAEIELARLESENSQLSARLETRKIVERAKGIMQRELKITEEEAYLTLQRESRQRGKSMKEIAEAILLNDEIRHTKKPSLVLPRAVPETATGNRGRVLTNERCCRSLAGWEARHIWPLTSRKI
jgi:putative methionine-R-sulfoxide reductase with GAF domain